MAIDYDKLMNFEIPDVEQDLTQRDTILYALSVGLGQNPTDADELRFVTEHGPLQALPSIATVLGYPGAWLLDPETGVDAAKRVHGEQGIIIHKPLPVEGKIVGKTRVAAIVDKGEGRGALLYVDKELRDFATGELLASAPSTIFLRGDGGFGGPSGPVKPAHRLPDRAPDTHLKLETRPEQALLYRLNGDYNPLHSDPAAAIAAGFDRPILHGLCTFGIVCHALVKVFGDSQPERLREMELRFSAPVLPGETISVEMWNDGSFQARVVERDAIVVSNGRSVFN
ncbi:MaoC/PaaZ C-terminal domain-containing protein [Sphingobium phenoxybenzoativorans]|uniref:MaoC/PaaZ C-terminal domain-containing protein n=1 Tax=Sphingobium phenoxybenzoativorans TaxID=1592790 RepID=UPI0008733200|nr:MaoC/PaaZ C-terminal domain-containing protein [Sphingobium phenoxybenzoativorans]